MTVERYTGSCKNEILFCRNENVGKQCHSCSREMSVANTIGTLNEKPLHAALKQWYAEPEDRIEAPVDGFTVDIVRGDLLIEIGCC
jgi:hypothetical protein